MKKILTVILAVVMLIVSVPFAVSAEDVSPMVLRCVCPTPSIDKYYVDRGNGYHAVICSYCDGQIRSELHTLQSGVCGDNPEYCLLCDYDTGFPSHEESEILYYGDVYHGTYCTRSGCVHNPSSSNFEGLLSVEEHRPLTQRLVHSSAWEDIVYKHYVTWECYACEHIEYESHDCVYQDPDCQGGCLTLN